MPRKQCDGCLEWGKDRCKGYSGCSKTETTESKKRKVDEPVVALGPTLPDTPFVVTDAVTPIVTQSSSADDPPGGWRQWYYTTKQIWQNDLESIDKRLKDEEQKNVALQTRNAELTLELAERREFWGMKLGLARGKYEELEKTLNREREQAATAKETARARFWDSSKGGRPKGAPKGDSSASKGSAQPQPPPQPRPQPQLLKGASKGDSSKA